MILSELLQACSTGKMPEVLYEGKRGQVTTIKDGDGHKGCGVKLDKDYVEWFHAEPGKDGRKKYMADLRLIPVQLDIETQSEAYLAGYNCGYMRPDERNCNSKYFATKEQLSEWTKGRDDGERDKQLKEEQKTEFIKPQ